MPDNLARKFEPAALAASKDAVVIALFAPVRKTNEEKRLEQLATQQAMAAAIKAQKTATSPADTRVQHQPKIW